MHVLSPPLAFALSQDQTLQFNLFVTALHRILLMQSALCAVETLWNRTETVTCFSKIGLVLKLLCAASAPIWPPISIDSGCGRQELFSGVLVESLGLLKGAHCSLPARFGTDIYGSCRLVSRKIFSTFFVSGDVPPGDPQHLW